MQLSSTDKPQELLPPLLPGSQPLGFGLWALLQVCLQPVSYGSDSGRYPNLLAWPSGLALSLWTLGWPWLLLLDLFCSSHLVMCECTLPSEVAGPACLAVSFTSRLAISLQSILPLLWQILYGPPSRTPEASQGIVTKTYEAFPDCARCPKSSINNCGFLVSSRSKPSRANHSQPLARLAGF